MRLPGPEAASSLSHSQFLPQRHRSHTGHSPFRSWSQGHLLRHAVPDTPGEPYLKEEAHVLPRSLRLLTLLCLPWPVAAEFVITLPLATY